MSITAVPDHRYVTAPHWMMSAVTTVPAWQLQGMETVKNLVQKDHGGGVFHRLRNRGASVPVLVADCDDGVDRVLQSRRATADPSACDTPPSPRRRCAFDDSAVAAPHSKAPWAVPSPFVQSRCQSLRNGHPMARPEPGYRSRDAAGTPAIPGRKRPPGPWQTGFGTR